MKCNTVNVFPLLFTYLFFILFYFFCFLEPHLQHIEVPRLGVELELQLPAYATATATAMQDLRCICDLHHSSHQCQVPDPMRETRDRTHILMDTSQIRFCCTIMEISVFPLSYDTLNIVCSLVYFTVRIHITMS